MHVLCCLRRKASVISILPFFIPMALTSSLMPFHVRIIFSRGYGTILMYLTVFFTSMFKSLSERHVITYFVSFAS